MTAIVDLSKEDFPRTPRGLAFALLRAMGDDTHRTRTAQEAMARAFALLRNKQISMIRIDHGTPPIGDLAAQGKWHEALRSVVNEGVAISFATRLNRSASGFPVSLARLVSSDGRLIASPSWDSSAD